MTPNELKALAVSQFQILFIEDPAINALLYQALGAWQDKAGCLRKITLGADVAEVDTPEDFLDIAIVLDAEGQYHEADASAETISITEQTGSVKPYTVHYFVNLRGMDPATGQLPNDAIGKLLDYLVTLIGIANAAQQRQFAGVIGTSQDGIPDETDLRNRKDALELDMEDSQAIIPMATVY